MRSLGPIFGFAALALVLVLGALALHLGSGLRHLLWARPWWTLAAILPVLAATMACGVGDDGSATAYRQVNFGGRT